MNLFKYYFSIIFNPKSEWQAVKKEMDSSSDLKSDVLALCLLLITTILINQYLWSLFSDAMHINFQSLIYIYTNICVKIAFIYIAVRMLFSSGKVSVLNPNRLIIICILSFGFPYILWGLFNKLVLPYIFEFTFYMPFGISSLILNIPFYLGIGYLVILGLKSCTDLDLNTSTSQSNFQLGLKLAAILLIVNLILGSIVNSLLGFLIYW